jgi:hypothetical protein
MWDHCGSWNRQSGFHDQSTSPGSCKLFKTSNRYDRFFFKYAYKPNKLYIGIAALKHPLFNVNVSGTHTNILIFEVNQKVDASQFCKELQEVKSTILLYVAVFAYYVFAVHGKTD